MCVTYNVFSNKIVLDSLYKIWIDSSLHDTIRSEAIYHYTWNGFLQSNLDSANKLAEFQLKLAESSNSAKQLSQSYNMKSIIAINLGNYNEALKYQYLALQQTECQKRWRCKQHFTNSLGNTYLKMDEYEKAMEHYQKALVIFNNNNIADSNQNTLALILNNIGNAHVDYKNYDSALIYFQKALQIHEDLKDSYGIARVNWNMGNCYKNDNLKSIRYWKSALTYFREIGAYNYVSSLSSNISSGYYDISDYVNSKKYADTSYKYAYQTGALKDMYNANNLKFKITNRKGKYKQALSYYEEAILIKDSLNRIENRKALVEEEIKYIYQKKLKGDSIFYAEEKRINEAELLLQDAKISSRRSLTKLFIIVLFVIVILSVVIWFRFQKSQDQKNIIQSQKNDVDQALADLKIKKKEIEHKNQEIINSINYAKYIQKSMLPDKEELKGFFTNHFIFNQPKDIVGGDFYWFKSFDDIAIIVAADCTGHGVPGGFITMLGNLLIENSTGFKAKNPDKILKELNRDIITLLKQDEVDSIQDGMDISICLIDKKKRKIKFSGARNGLFIVNGDDVKSIKGSVSPVGGVYTKKEAFMERDYNLEEIKVHENDWVFMYTDGYYDQFGGEKRKSMGSKKFTQILIESINNKKTNTEFFKDKFDQWKSNQSQIDDVLIIGFKI